MARNKNKKKGSKGSNADATASTSQASYNPADTAVLTSLTAGTAFGPLVHIGTRFETVEYDCEDGKCPESSHSYLVPFLAVIDGSRQLSTKDYDRIDELFDRLQSSEKLYTVGEQSYKNLVAFYKKKKSTASRFLSLKADTSIKGFLSELSHLHGGSFMSTGDMTDEDWREIDTRDGGGQWPGAHRKYMVLPQLSVGFDDDIAYNALSRSRGRSEGSRGIQN